MGGSCSTASNLAKHLHRALFKAARHVIDWYPVTAEVCVKLFPLLHYITKESWVWLAYSAFYYRDAFLQIYPTLRRKARPK